jgi:radical SAM protein with 4Fe4S-binding SPASM domain
MLEREVSIKETAPYRLSNHCKLVSGAKRAAIYDLKENDIYSINETASQIITGSPDKFDFWKKLTELGLTAVSTDDFSPEIKMTIPQVGLEFMWLELTARCNQRCIHCYAESDSSGSNENMPVSKWERVIEEGKSLGCRKLQFIGGEPLLFKGIFDLAQTARDLDYEFIEIFTNGTLLDEEKVKRIKDLGINMAVSFYSIVPEIHEKVTQVPGSFQKTFRTLKMLKEAGIPTRIGIVVMRQNQDFILETQRKLQEMGFATNRADVVRPSGRGSCADLLPKDEIIQTWALMTKPDFSTSKEQFYRNQHWNSCWARKIAITADGGIMPCIFAREHLVSSVEIGLEEAINSEGLQNLWKITKDQVEGCQNCEYRYACHDCRPLAEGTTGNLYAKNPRCTYDPYSGEWQKGGEKK